MKQMTRTIKIAYRWWRNDGRAIKKPHKEALEETAMNIIGDAMADDFTSGELNDNIHMDGDPPDGIAYRGHWEIEKS